MNKSDIMEKPIRVAVVVAEPLARAKIKVLLESESDYRLVFEAGDGQSALDYLKDQTVDLMFLDIRMPGLDGFQLLANLATEGAPAIILTTAYDRYALRAFEANAVDYLLKPFDFERFKQALVKARRWLNQAPPVDHLLEVMLAARGSDRIAVRDNNRIRFIETSHIDWAESAGNYVVLHLAGETVVNRKTLAAMESLLAPRGFMRVHRTALVAINKIEALEADGPNRWVALLPGGQRINVGRGYVKGLMDRLGG